jgi:hypothetical protein
VTVVLQSRRKEISAVDINVSAGPAALITILVKALRRSAICMQGESLIFTLKDTVIAIAIRSLER